MNAIPSGRSNFTLPADPSALNDQLQGESLEKVLETVTGVYPPERIAVISAFGPGSLVVLHALNELKIRLPVIFIDTLHNFAETIDHVERIRAHFDLDLRVYRHCESRQEFEERYGERLWERDLDRYQELAKVEPFQRATAGLDAWFTGRRREQSDTRASLRIVEPGDQVRINPLAEWSKGEVWNYILDYEIPYNPLHDQGYASIGDEPLTTAVGAEESERAGRWRGLGRTECGIHQY